MKKLRQRTLISAFLSTATTCSVAIQYTTPVAAQGSYLPQVNGYQNGYTDNATTTIRDPYIPGVMLTPPLRAPVVMPLPPPPGSGLIPPGVTPGQAGPPPGVSSNFYPPDEPLYTNTVAPPANFQLPLVAPTDTTTLNGALAPYLSPPPSAQGPQPLILQPPGSALQPPGVTTGPAASASASALQVTVPNDGVLTDQGMPTTRDGYQSTQDFGIQSTNTSYNTDFGVRPSQNANTYQGRNPNQTLVGIRLETYPGVMGQVNNTAPNIPGAFKVIAGGANDQVPGTGTHTLWPNNGGTYIGSNYGNSLSPASGYINANPQFSPISYTPPNGGSTDVNGNPLNNVVQTPPSGSFYTGDNATNFQEGNTGPTNFQPFDTGGGGASLTGGVGAITGGGGQQMSFEGM